MQHQWRFWRNNFLVLVVGVAAFVFFGWVGLMVLRHYPDGALGKWIVAIVELCTLAATWQSVRFWWFTRNLDEFIELDKDEIRYQVYPTGSGSLKYHYLKYIDLQYDNYRGRIYNGKLILKYLLPEDKPDTADLHCIIIDLKRLKYVNPKLSWWQHWQRTYLQNIQQLYDEVLQRAPQQQLLNELEREILRNRDWLATEKQRNREWLDHYKDKPNIF